MYAAEMNPRKLLILDPKFQENYDPFDDLGRSKSLGSGPARNFAWEHSKAAGHARHWCMDDNIDGWYWLRNNQKLRSVDAGPIVAMEDFVLRYRNIAMAGPQYDYFIPARTKQRPFITGTRIFSCNLIRNDLPMRWRGRYNEDADLSLRMLKAGWATVLFHAFLASKLPTGLMSGGNADEIYKEGTLAKSRMLVDMHPDVVTLVQRYGRPHHHIDFRRWLGQRLIPDPAAPIPRNWKPSVLLPPGRIARRR